MAARLGAPHLHTLSGFSLRHLPRSVFPLQPHDYRRFLNMFCPLLQSSDASSSAFICCWLHIASSCCCCFCFRQAYLAVGRSRFRGSGIFIRRSHVCGTLEEMHVGERVSICGWVASQRSHGSVTFVNLRDHTGIVQVTNFVYLLLSVFSFRIPFLCLRKVCMNLF
jgi:hypothetical protein